MKVSDIATCIEEIAPLSLQEDYDNAGWQVEDKYSEATGALLCIDVTEEVVDEAISLGVNLIISHHPLLFKGVKSLTGKNYVERTVIKAIQHNISIYASHTNLDNAWSGVNFKMAEKLGLTNLSILMPQGGKLLKLVTYVPVSHADIVRNALFTAGCGNIGDYDLCSYNSNGFGTFRAGLDSHPYCGTIGNLHQEEETRIETVLPEYLKEVATQALLKTHPYEEPAFDFIKIENQWVKAGSGVVGELLCPMDEMDFLQRTKTVFHAGCIKYSNLRNRRIRRVALCGGAGAFLISQAIASDADVFITGEIKYHDYFGYDEHILLAEVGHYETEQYTKDIFCDIITKKFPNFAVHYTKVETNPINYL